MRVTRRTPAVLGHLSSVEKKAIKVIDPRKTLHSLYSQHVTEKRPYEIMPKLDSAFVRIRP
jgi:hypothetical protein